MLHTDTSAVLHRTLHIDLADFLFRLGHRPLEEKNGIFIFSSPFLSRGKLTVDSRLNRFSDPALNITEGDILDFGQAYYNCRIPRLLDIITHVYPFKNNLTEHPDEHARILANYQDDLQVLRVSARIEHPRQQQLLSELNIPLDIAVRHISGIEFIHRGVEKQGITFLNNADGRVILDGDGRLFYGRRDISTSNSGAGVLNVFEHFEDMLAHQQIFRNEQQSSGNTLVLNSLYAFEQARPFMERHERINLYLRHDRTSRQYTGYAQ